MKHLQRKRRKLGWVVLNGSLLEKSESSRSPWLGSVGWVARVLSSNKLCIYLFLTVLGLCCCMGFSLVGVSGGLLFTAVCRLLIVVACLLEHGLWDRQAWVVVAHGLSSCPFQALEHKLSSYGVGSAAPRHVGSPWIKDRTEPVFLVLASGFFTAEPPGKPQVIYCRGGNAHFLRCGLW